MGKDTDPVPLVPLQDAGGPPVIPVEWQGELLCTSKGSQSAAVKSSSRLQARDEKELGSGFAVVSIPCVGGVGVVASKSFQVGDVVMCEEPLISMPDAVFSNSDGDYAEEWLDRRILQLSSRNREIFYDLVDSQTQDCDGQKTALGIFYTNCMSFIDESAAVFPTMSRVNHSCLPNAEFIMREQLGVQSLIAIKPIEAGEEVTLNYLPSAGEGSDISSVRRDYTCNYYGFMCNCPICLMQECQKEKKEDEALRTKVKCYQERGMDDLTLEEVEELVDAAEHIEEIIHYSMVPMVNVRKQNVIVLYEWKEGGRSSSHEGLSREGNG